MIALLILRLDTNEFLSRSENIQQCSYNFVKNETVGRVVQSVLKPNPTHFLRRCTSLIYVSQIKTKTVRTVIKRVLSSQAFFGFVLFNLEYRKTPPNATPVPSALTGEIGVLKKRTDATMTTTRLTQLATEWVTGDTLARIK